LWDFTSAFYILVSFWWALIRIRTLYVVVLSLASTYIAMYYNIRSDMPLNLLSIGIIFPISFCIQYSLNRRERVLLDVASLKASIISMFFLAREWAPKRTDGVLSPIADKMKVLLQELMDEMVKYLSHIDEGQNIYSIYEKFDGILSIVEEIRVTDDWLKSVVSRAYQNHRLMINDFERIRTVTDYRTPSAFRGFAYIWLTIFPILFGPYFAQIDYDAGGVIWAGLYSALICSLMLVTLSNIYDDLEDPFDGKGVDDLNMEVLKEPKLLFVRHLNDEDRKKHRKETVAKHLRRAHSEKPHELETSEG